jgi:hypothetical protein
MRRRKAHQPVVAGVEDLESNGKDEHFNKYGKSHSRHRHG